jgi:hypothetical protein
MKTLVCKGGALVFEERSVLAVSAACVVANSVRESLASTFGTPVELRLFEPTIPSHQGWQTIAREAMLFRMRGSRGDVAIVLRAADASALARAAFAEFEPISRELSSMEASVLHRIVGSLASAFPVLCGSSVVPQPCESIDGFSTYFELQIERPMLTRIGIALSKEPSAEPRGILNPEALVDLKVELTVRSAEVHLNAAAIAALEPGDFVPITSKRGRGYTLYLAGRPLASGECGVRGERFAFAIDHLHQSEGSQAAVS